MTTIEFAGKIMKDFGSGALGFLTLGASHYVYVCRENDKQLQIIQNERLMIEKTIDKENQIRRLEYELQKKELDEKINKRYWFY